MSEAIYLTGEGLAQQLFLNEVNRLGALGSPELISQLADQAQEAVLLYRAAENRRLGTSQVPPRPPPISMPSSGSKVTR